MRSANAPRLAALLLVGLLHACGGDDAPEQTEEVAPPPAQDEGMVLASDDFAGIEEANVTFNLHWVQGPVNRDPERQSPPVNEIQEVTTLAGSTFDRVIFRLGEGSIPGYAITWTDSPTVNCTTNQPVEVAGARKLTVRLLAVTAVPAAVRAQDPRHENLQAVAHTCTQDTGVVEYTFGVNEQAQVRVIEMRDPRRLVVDVRHDPPGS
jgi:hypothetical protein